MVPAPDTPGRTAAKRVPRAERERQMLEAAALLFGEKGYDATSMDDVAAACGITKPMVYAYFESKEGLYSAMLTRAGARLISEFAAVMDPADPRSTMRASTTAFLNFVERFHGSWQMVFSRLPHQGRELDTLIAARRQIMKSICYILVRLPENGRRTPEALKAAEPFAHAWLGTCEQVAQWWLSSSEYSKADAQRVLSVLLDDFMATVTRQAF